ncbi:MAG: hypothetical protein DMG26_09945 [Acidobacteria bacterium]|nr:MAG: hypothetical protein DMG25_11560 [Acidobacteriota bacterium]PYV03170.1 MAG: hypothetical protein DMG26_09945 [Acidobacteriota bacterium]
MSFLPVAYAPAVPAPAPTPAPIAAPLPWPAKSPIRAPAPAPPAIHFASCFLWEAPRQLCVEVAIS